VADGKVFSAVAFPASVIMPDQRALICYTNGTERLVVETRFTGSGTNFAWVVPLPAQPQVEQASTGLFPTLHYLFQPRINHDVPRYYLGIIALIGLTILIVTVRPDQQFHWLDLAACGLVGFASALAADEPFLALIPFSLLVCCVVVVRFILSPVLSVIAVALIALALVGLVLPVTVTSRSKAAAMSSSVRAKGVQILDRRLVGVYETTTITAHEPKALQS